ncbi:MAG: hypothetical protein WC549_09610 [Actinomycetota bacterium]
MFSEYSIEEKREFLRLSRVRMDIETKVPRQKATDCIVERGIFGCSFNKPCSKEEINKTIASLGLMNGLRLNELQSSLERLLLDQKVKQVDDKFMLDTKRVSILELEAQEGDRRFDTIVNRVYKPIIDKTNQKILSRFFLEFISVVFSRFGDQWIKSLCNQAVQKDFLKESDIRDIFKKIAKSHGLPKKELEYIMKLSIKFFEDRDPDYDYLKFNLAQSFYISKILGVDTPIDLFSKEIFSGSIFYLDTNLIFASLLPSSRHNVTFKELLRICSKIGIQLNVSIISRDEVERVVSHFEREAVNIFDEIPEKIIPKVRGTFFESYIEEKKKNPIFSVADLFKPFHILKETLKTVFSIDIIDDSTFDSLFLKAEKDIKLQSLFNSKSIEVRHRNKGRESLLHDVFHYLLIEEIRLKEKKEALFLTIDTSLPHVAATLQQSGDKPFCLTLDVLMQSFSPFITTEQDVQDFSEVFSKLIANQLFPLSKLFDVRDFIFYSDIGMKISEMSENDIEESLVYIKNHVLKGRIYSHADFEKVAYEVKKLFSGRADKDETIRKQLERISEMERKHNDELLQKEAEIQLIKDEKNKIIENIEDTRKLSKLKRSWYGKLAIFILISLICLSILIYLTKRYAEGANLFQKIVKSWELYVLWGLIVSFCFNWIEKRDLFIKTSKDNTRNNKDKKL